jgi:hypothetical protein
MDGAASGAVLLSREARKERVMDQQHLTPKSQGTAGGTSSGTRKRSATAAEKLGGWQRLLAPLAANSADLPHLDTLRTQLSTMATQVGDLSKQQAAQRAAKQDASRQLEEMMTEGQRLASLLRQAVRQHYGIRSEKLAEFGLQPFRGKKKTPPPPAPEIPTTPAPELAAPVK